MSTKGKLHLGGRGGALYIELSCKERETKSELVTGKNWIGFGMSLCETE
jgi:hypothetical protein